MHDEPFIPNGPCLATPETPDQNPDTGATTGKSGRGGPLEPQPKPGD